MVKKTQPAIRNFRLKQNSATRSTLHLDARHATRNTQVEFLDPRPPLLGVLRD